MKTIPLSSLASSKPSKVKIATPRVPTGRTLDELRIRPGSNGYVIHSETNPVKLATNKVQSIGAPQAPHIAATKAAALAHVDSILSAHEAAKAK